MNKLKIVFSANKKNNHKLLFGIKLSLAHFNKDIIIMLKIRKKFGFTLSEILFGYLSGFIREKTNTKLNSLHRIKCICKCSNLLNFQSNLFYNTTAK